MQMGLLQMGRLQSTCKYPEHTCFASCRHSRALDYSNIELQESTHMNVVDLTLVQGMCHLDFHYEFIAHPWISRTTNEQPQNPLMNPWIPANTIEIYGLSRLQSNELTVKSPYECLNSSLNPVWTVHGPLRTLEDISYREIWPHRPKPY